MLSITVVPAGEGFPAASLTGTVSATQGSGKMAHRRILGSFVWTIQVLVLAACASAPAPTPQIIFVTPSPPPPTPQIIFVTPSPGPATPPGETASPTAALPSGETAPPTVEPTATPTEPPTPSPTPTASPTPKPTVTPKPTPTPTPKPTVPTTSIKVVQMGLGDPDNPDSKSRQMTFTSDGTGDVSVKVSGVAPGQKVEMCFAIGSHSPFCQTVFTQTFIGHTGSQKTVWHVTLNGATSGMVTRADLTVTFPAKSPTITLKDFYLSGGSSYPGLTVDVTPRKPCPLALAVTVDDTSVPVTTDVKDLTEPGSTPPAPGSSCASPPTGWTPYGAIGGHRYEIGITTTSVDEHFATLDLRWP